MHDIGGDGVHELAMVGEARHPVPRPAAALSVAGSLSHTATSSLSAIASIASKWTIETSPQPTTATLGTSCLRLHISANSGTPFLAGQLFIDLHVSSAGLRHHLRRNRRPWIGAAPITQRG